MVVSDLRALVSGMLSGRTKPLVAFIQQTPESEHELLAVRVGDDPRFGRNCPRASAVRTVALEKSRARAGKLPRQRSRDVISGDGRRCDVEESGRSHERCDRFASSETLPKVDRLQVQTSDLGGKARQSGSPG